MCFLYGWLLVVYWLCLIKKLKVNISIQHVANMQCISTYLRFYLINDKTLSRIWTCVLKKKVKIHYDSFRNLGGYVIMMCLKFLVILVGSDLVCVSPLDLIHLGEELWCVDIEQVIWLGFRGCCWDSISFCGSWISL